MERKAIVSTRIHVSHHVLLASNLQVSSVFLLENPDIFQALRFLSIHFSCHLTIQPFGCVVSVLIFTRNVLSRSNLVSLYFLLLIGSWNILFGVYCWILSALRGAFNKFPDCFVLAFKIVVDSWKFITLLLYILWYD